MHLVFSDTTLTNPHEQVKQTGYTRQMLLDGIIALFQEKNLQLVAVTDEAAPFVTAFGIRRTSQGAGLGLKVEAAPSACGTGIIFEAQAMASYGQTWETLQRFTYRVSETHAPVTCHGLVSWSTSKLLAQFDEPGTCPPHFVDALEDAVNLEMQSRAEETMNDALLRSLNERFNPSERGEFYRPGYNGRIVASDQGPGIMLTLNSVPLDKMLRIMDILEQ